MNQAGVNIPSKLGRNKKNFHCTEAVSENTFRNLLRNDSTKVDHKENRICSVQPKFLKKINDEKYKSALDLNMTSNNQDSSSGKKQNIYNKYFKTNFLIDYKEAVNKNSQIPFIKHKRNFRNIQQMTGIRGDTLNLTKLYEKNEDFTTTARSFKKLDSARNINNNDLNTSAISHNAMNSSMTAGLSASKKKFINEMLTPNPMKVVSYKDRVNYDLYNKQVTKKSVSPVCSYLGSNAVKKHLVNEADKFIDDMGNKITKSNLLNNTKTKILEKMKFKHMYDKKNRAFYF